LILPIDAAEDFIKTANENSLFLFKKTMIIPRVTKAANRVMMAFSKTKKPYFESTVTIRNAGNGYHDYSPEFIELLKDFLIIF
jgi:tRNA1(Val) A37 N6-methylase TrmN6